MTFTVDRSTCVITGASRGLGQAVVLEMARRGWRVLGVCRTRQGATRLLDAALREQLQGSVQVEIADLSRLAHVRALAGRVCRRMARLDALFNNAAIALREPFVSEDGVEMTFAVNYLSHFLLSYELLPLLHHPGSRVINLNCDAHRKAALSFSDWDGRGDYDGLQAYNRSKLAGVIFNQQLAQHLRSDGVSVHAVDPGALRTRLLRGFGPGVRMESQSDAVLPRHAAGDVALVATDPRYGKTTGLYLRHGKPITPAQAADNPVVSRQLWQLSIRLCQMPKTPQGATAPLESVVSA